MKLSYKKMKNPEEIQANYSNITIIIVLILLLMTGIAGAFLGPYSIIGLVTDTSGTPIDSATVTTNTTLSTSTNATGWYIFTEVPNATHLITASKTDYSSNTTTVTVNGANITADTIIIETETIDVTLTGVPIDFGNVSSVGSTYPSLSPLNVTIQNTTNVNVNITLSGSDFIYGEYSFGVGNLSYSNSSGGSRTNMDTSFSLSPYGNWINMIKRANHEREIYFWLSIPAGQEPGTYVSNIYVMVERYT